MPICETCLHRNVCGKYTATGGTESCRYYIFEEKVWCNNCYEVYRKVDVKYKGVVQYCPDCGLMIGTMVGNLKKCSCGAIIPEHFNGCPNCCAKMDGGSLDV